MTATDRYSVLTRVGKGTPMGKYMRFFWYPVAASLRMRFSSISSHCFLRMTLRASFLSQTACSALKPASFGHSLRCRQR